MSTELKLRQFKYCPVCGEELEILPGFIQLSCFEDGDIYSIDKETAVFKLVGGYHFE